jgi:hypothetical protein
MESTGEPGKVQCSADTADLLTQGGQHTLVYRGLVDAKGKGKIKTFWLTQRAAGRGSISELGSMAGD